MATGRRIARTIGAALAAAAILLPLSGAWAGGNSCSLNDVWNALQNTLNTLPAGASKGSPATQSARRRDAR
jgi:hypothetical protein